MSTPTTTDDAAMAAMFDAMLNLSAFHREHEKYYSVAPREQAVVLQRHARTLHALADRWSEVAPQSRVAINPYEGAVDLNAPAATQLDGVLFMEGGDQPGEITRMKRDLRVSSDDAAGAGQWLATAMRASWDAAAALLGVEGLGDVLGERHRIIANNWLGASMMEVASNVLVRAAELLDQVDFAPAALRDDLAHQRVAAGRLHSAAEMIDHAADLFSEFAGVVHDNERRWRVFRASVGHMRAALLVAPA